MDYIIFMVENTESMFFVAIRLLQYSRLILLCFAALRLRLFFERVYNTARQGSQPSHLTLLTIESRFLGVTSLFPRRISLNVMLNMPVSFETL